MRGERLHGEERDLGADAPVNGVALQDMPAQPFDRVEKRVADRRRDVHDDRALVAHLDAGLEPGHPRGDGDAHDAAWPRREGSNPPGVAPACGTSSLPGAPGSAAGRRDRSNPRPERATSRPRRKPPTRRQGRAPKNRDTAACDSWNLHQIRRLADFAERLPGRRMRVKAIHFPFTPTFVQEAENGLRASRPRASLKYPTTSRSPRQAGRCGRTAMSPEGPSGTITLRAGLARG